MRDYLERALQIQDPHYGPDHIQVAITLMSLGIAYGELGDASKMRDYFERALQIEDFLKSPIMVQTIQKWQQR
eukprot:477903-Amphidinium_carterae.1